MKDTYESPLASRYASREMLYIFSPDKKFTTWRRLWIALARAEMELGLPITQGQIDEMEREKDHINYDLAQQKEKELRHDVMAHIHAYGALCPSAMPIIHLGATSCYVGDNTDIILMREGMALLRDKLVRILAALGKFADQYKALPTLGYTHYQAAQMVTVGKRATLWMNELLMDLEELEYRMDHLKMLGCKGTTGTQASFLELFGGDESKVQPAGPEDRRRDGLRPGPCPSPARPTPEKWMLLLLATLSGIAQSAHKFATDLRLLCHMKEIEEPFEKHQVGSSAMPYKRNPMRSERICALARYVIADAMNPAMTSSTAMVRAHPGRLRQQAHRRLRGLPGRGCHFEPLSRTWPPAWSSTRRSSKSTSWRSCPSWPRKTSSWTPSSAAGTARPCTSASAPTPWPPAAA